MIVSVELASLLVFNLQFGISKLLLLDYDGLEIRGRNIYAIKLDCIVVDGILELVVDRHDYELICKLIDLVHISYMIELLDESNSCWSWLCCCCCRLRICCRELLRRNSD